MKNLKVGVIGSGQVGQTLANGFLKFGHDVMMGTREKGKLKAWLEQSGGKGRVGSFAEAAQFGDIVVIAVKGSAVMKAVESIGENTVRNKIIIDVNNPIADEAPVNGVLKFFTGPNESLMEMIQAKWPQSKVVKAFSCIGHPYMINPQFSGGPPTMFICGNHDDAKQTVKDILEQFGWETCQWALQNAP